MARTLLVSPEQRGAFATIRDALAAADPGAVISVAPGDYAETLAVRQQRVTITARDAGTVTITSPSQEDPAVSVVGGQVELHGLTLRSTERPAVLIQGGE